jgi:hypothetical protein
LLTRFLRDACRNWDAATGTLTERSRVPTARGSLGLRILSEPSLSDRIMESAVVRAEAVGLLQGVVDRREFGIDLGFYSGHSDENPERYT